MSIVRVGRIVACACSKCGSNAVRTITSTFRPHKNVTPEQPGFHGLFSGFLYDDKHGFGYNKDGDLVIVTPDATTFTKAPTATVNDIETETLLEVAKGSFMNKTEPATDFRVPLTDSLSDDETEYFLNAAKNSYPNNKKDDKEK